MRPNRSATPRPGSFRKAHRIPLAAFALFLGLALLGCTADDESATQSEATSAPKEAPETIDIEAIHLQDTAALLIVPAPSEIVALVEQEEHFANVEQRLDIPLPSYQDMPPWQRALSLGRVMADLLIAAPRASDAQLASYLGSASEGLRSLGADQDWVEKAEELRSRVAAGGISRERLLDEFDRLRADLFRAGGDQLGEQNLVLVAIGGWARAVNLVSNITLETGEVPVGADVLKLRLIVSTLIENLGSGEEVRPVVESLRSILPVTAHVPSEPTDEDLRTLIAETDEILALTLTG